MTVTRNAADSPPPHCLVTPPAPRRRRDAGRAVANPPRRAHPVCRRRANC